MIALMSSFLLLNSCVDEIELDVPRGQTESLVVQGSFVLGDSPKVAVLVSRIFSFDGSSLLVKARTVELVDEQGRTEPLNFVEEGVYEKTIDVNNSNLSIQTGMQFKIRIELFDGRIIESKLETLRAVKANSEASLSLREKSFITQAQTDVLDRDRLVINLKSEINNIQSDPQRFRWFVNATYRFKDNPQSFEIDGRESKYCYFSHTFKVEEQMLFDGFNFNQESTIYESEVFCGRLAESFYFDTIYFNVIQESLSEDAYNYFYGIGETLKLSGGMFDPAAGKIKSNLFNVNDPDEEVFGYFYVSEQASTNVLFTPDIIGASVFQSSCFASPPDNFNPLSCGRFACCDCGNQRGASIIKPDYWK